MQISARARELRAEMEALTGTSARVEVTRPGRIRIRVAAPPMRADCWPDLIAVCRSVGRYGSTDAGGTSTLWIELREDDDDD